jgi:hypothetical protein
MVVDGKMDSFPVIEEEAKKKTAHWQQSQYPFGTSFPDS